MEFLGCLLWKMEAFTLSWEGVGQCGLAGPAVTSELHAWRVGPLGRAEGPEWLSA